VNVVDHGHAPAAELDRQHREGIGQVVTVEDVGAEVADRLTKIACRPLAQPVPAREELVAGSVGLGERLSAVGDRELDVRPDGAQRGGVFAHAGAWLLL